MKFRSAALVMTALVGFAAPAAAQNANADWGAPPGAPSNGPQWGAPPSGPSNGPQWGPPPGAAPQAAPQQGAVRNVTPGRESSPPPAAAAAPQRPASQAMAPAPAPAAPPGWGPPPGQAAGPQWGPPGGAPGGMQAGNQVIQQEPPCAKDVMPLRAAVERDGGLVKKAIDSKADRAVVCNGLKKFAATEAKFVNYLDKNQQFCGVPAEIVTQLKKNHSHTVKLRGQACATGPGPAQAGRPQGTGLSEALGTSRGPAPVINRGGAFGTLTGSAIAR